MILRFFMFSKLHVLKDTLYFSMWFPTQIKNLKFGARLQYFKWGVEGHLLPSFLECKWLTLTQHVGLVNLPILLCGVLHALSHVGYIYNNVCSLYTLDRLKILWLDVMLSLCISLQNICGEGYMPFFNHVVVTLASQ